MHFRCQVFLLVTLVLALSGCASNEKIQFARNAPLTKVCCDSYSQMPFRRLSTGEQLQVEIDADSPVFSFPEGSSRFAAFQFPRNSSLGVLAIKTTIIGVYMPDAFVFYPAFTFLDDEFRTIQHVDPKLKYEKTILASTHTMGWVAEVPIPNNARYVIAHTPRDKVGVRLYYNEDVTNPTGSVAFTGKTAIFLPGNWWDVYLPAIGAGRLRVELRGDNK